MGHLTDIHIITFELVLSKISKLSLNKQTSRSNCKSTRNTGDRRTCDQQTRFSTEQMIWFLQQLNLTEETGESE